MKYEYELIRDAVLKLALAFKEEETSIKQMSKGGKIPAMRIFATGQVRAAQLILSAIDREYKKHEKYVEEQNESAKGWEEEKPQ